MLKPKIYVHLTNSQVQKSLRNTTIRNWREFCQNAIKIKVLVGSLTLQEYLYSPV
jgi:hypothetical protein